MRQRDDGARDRRRFGAGVAFHDEGTVDLERVDREALQVGERGVAGTEVVDRDGDAHRLQFVQHGERPLHIAHQHAFGDFQFEIGRRQPGFIEHRTDQRRQIAFAEQAGRNIDRDVQITISRCPPAGRLVTGLAHDEPGQLRNQAGFFGERDELDRRNTAEFIAVPAHQRLEAAGAAARIDLRLIDDIKFFLLDGAAQGRVERQAVARRGIERFGIELELPLAQLLGMVHRRVGMAQQRFEIFAIVRIDADADAAIDAHFVAVEHDRLGHGLLNAVQDLQRVAEAAVIAKDEHELVTAVTRHGIRLAQAGLEALGGFDQQFVAGTVAKAVVHKLEVIEIDEGQRAVRALALRQTQQLLQAVLQQVAVGQAGQRIVRCLVFELLAVVVLRRDILDRAFVIERLAFRAIHDVGVLGNPDTAAVAAIDFGFEIGDAPGIADALLEFLAPAGCDVEPGGNVGQSGDQGGGRFIAIKTGQRQVGGQVMAVDRGLEHADHRVFEDAAIAQFGIGELALAEQLLGDVLDETFDHALPLFVEHDGTAFEHPDFPAVAVQQAILQAIATAPGHRRSDHLAGTRPVIRMGDHLERDDLVVFQFVRAVTGQLAAAIADKVQGPVIVDGAAEDHAFKVVHQHLQDAITVDVIPDGVTPFAQDRKKTRRRHDIFHVRNKFDQQARSWSKNPACNKFGIFTAFYRSTAKNSGFPLRRAPRWRKPVQPGA